MALRSLRLSRRLGFLGQFLTPTVLQLGLLMVIDLVTNITDYGFHLYLGWALLPADFAIVQTINAVLLILVTAFGVTQPVVARFIAAAGTDVERSDRSGAVFQAYFWQGSVLGSLLLILALLAARPVAAWLNVPVAAVVVAAPMILLAFLPAGSLGDVTG